MSRYYRSFLEESTIPYTTRTTAFATATGITDTTILGALNTFDLGLISNSLDTKMKAVYPFVGGTASTHKYNFFDPLDTNGAFRLQFNGGITHSSNGILFGGVNGYANTFLSPLTTLSLNNTHVSLYSRTNNTTAVFDMQSTGAVNSPTLAINFGSTTSYYNVNQGAYSTVVDASSSGFRMASRLSSTTEKLFKNNSLLSTGNVNSYQLSNGVIDIGRWFNGSYYSDREYAFISIGNGLTDGEATTFYNLIQNMQTTLSRNV